MQSDQVLCCLFSQICPDIQVYNGTIEFELWDKFCSVHVIKDHLAMIFDFRGFLKLVHCDINVHFKRESINICTTPIKAT